MNTAFNFSPSVTSTLIFQLAVILSTLSANVFAQTNGNLIVTASRKGYKYDESIAITYNNLNAERTNYMAVYKNKSAVKWGKESFWSSLCGSGDQASWPCDNVPDSTGTVVFSVKDPIFKGGDGTNWPPPQGKYKACLLNRNENENNLTELKCVSFRVKGVKRNAWKKATAKAAQKTYTEGETITVNFSLKKKKDAVTNQVIALYKGKKPTVLLKTDPITWIYAGCNNQEGDQVQTKYCSKKKKKGAVSITDSKIKWGKYYACLMFDNNKPHTNFKCSKKFNIEKRTDTLNPTTSPVTSPIFSPTTSSPTNSSPTKSTPIPTPGVLSNSADPTPQALPPWVNPSELEYDTLSCNQNAPVDIDSSSCLDKAVSFSDLYNPLSTDPLSVPCGQCVLMDYTDGSTLEIPGGLHILGRLHFDPSSNVVVRTTGVFVQGSWSMEIPNVGNQVKILLYGFEEQTLYPHDDCCSGNIFHLNHCDEECEGQKIIGKKPFIIAGGKLNIRAVDPTCKSWTKLQSMDADTLNTVTLDIDFTKCLRPGDSLLFTSDRKSIQYETLNEVLSVDKITGVVTLQTTMPYLYPAIDGPGESYMASEVALLRRDVVFEAEVEPMDEEIGGHSIVFHTPYVEQVIQGVQFENFGQAGVLGRYPIHFHKSGISPSLISKNLIINSNQRCVFIHNTNEVTIDDNVAYNTAGHCYATETGAEVNNIFSNNLGAHTKKLRRSNGQSDSAEGFHKHQAATFWFRNMENTFIGNVAAGSESIGFWIEMTDITRNQLHPESFRNNAAHSCSSEGLITYKKGWKPVNPGFIDGFHTYNNQEGVKFHITGNIQLSNFFIADNAVGVRYGAWNENVVLKDSSIIAMSQDSQQRLGKTCPSTYYGIEASFNDRPERMGQIRLENISFVGFKCWAKMIRHRAHNLMQDDMGDSIEYRNVVIEDSEEISKPVFICDDPFDQNVFMEDSEGKFGPDDKGIGFIIRNNDRMKAFLPDGACEVVTYDEDECTAFCEGVCMRLVTVRPDGRSSSNGYKELQLTHLVTGQEHTFAAAEDGFSTVVLPVGPYEGSYIDVNGELMLLDAVTVETYRAPRCGDFTVEITFPTVPPTISPTDAPTKSANPTYSMYFVMAGEDLKCPDDETRLFKTTAGNPHDVDECYQLCYDEPGCEYFSLMEEGGACIGCTTYAELGPASGIDSYQLTVFQWFWPAGDDLKCPFDESRLFKFTAEDIVDCWDACYNRPSCDYFTHNVDNGDCMGCSVDAAFQSDTGYQVYQIETYRDFPYTFIADRKCPYADRIDTKTKTSTRDGCWQLCKDNYDCVLFTYGEGDNLSSTDSGTCMLCKYANTLDGHVGFNSFELN